MLPGIVSVRASFFNISSILKLRESIIFGFLQGPEINKYSEGVQIHETKHRH